jgi:hypothetical protein
MNINETVILELQYERVLFIIYLNAIHYLYENMFGKQADTVPYITLNT